MQADRGCPHMKCSPCSWRPCALALTVGQPLPLPYLASGPTPNCRHQTFFGRGTFSSNCCLCQEIQFHIQWTPYLMSGKTWGIDPLDLHFSDGFTLRNIILAELEGYSVGLGRLQLPRVVTHLITKLLLATFPSLHSLLSLLQVFLRFTCKINCLKSDAETLALAGLREVFRSRRAT